MSVIKWVTINGQQLLYIPAGGGRFTTLTPEEATELIQELTAALRTKPQPGPDDGGHGYH